MNVLRLREGASGEAAIQELRNQAREAGNVVGRSAGRPDEQILDDYLVWTEQAERLLGNVFDFGIVDSLIYTSRYRLIRTASPEWRRLPALISSEIDNRQRLLNAHADALQEEQQRWRGRAATLVIPDTNMFLQEDAPLENIDWPAAVKSRVDVRLVVPLLVVRELDRLKRRGNQVTVKEARRAIKWLEANLPMTPHGTSAPLSNSPRTTVEVYVQHEPARAEEVDGLIIEFARQLSSVSRMRTRLVTRDLGMRLQAEALGVDVVTLDEP